GCECDNLQAFLADITLHLQMSDFRDVRKEFRNLISRQKRGRHGAAEPQPKKVTADFTDSKTNPCQKNNVSRVCSAKREIIGFAIFVISAL
ncbi:MAG: hypothetical protein KAV99_07455, partial [Candidatus Latescibacteria bacterium]|nr:hypothetical protein [Candidatus Latescibacterota bacterium]